MHLTNLANQTVAYKQAQHPMTRHHMIKVPAFQTDDIHRRQPTMKVVGLVLVALATVGQCALLGTDKCTYGPSYWCSHIHHAKECDAMQHCITTVWKYQRGDMVGSTETCFDVIKVLDVVRHSNDEHLLEQWAVGCTGMPAESRHVCKELLKDDMKEVSKLLKSELPAKQIAAALNLCGGFADHVPRQELKTKASGDYCKDCINFMGDLVEIFNNTEGQAEAMFKKMVCAKAGPLEGLCDQLVDQYGKMVFSLITQQLNPQVLCRDLRMCANQSRAFIVQNFEKIMIKRQKSSAGCDVCKSLAKDLQDALRDATLQKEIMSALKDKVCPILGSLASECKNYVDTYGPLVFEILVGELDPQTVCQTIGLCNGTQSDNAKLVHVPLSSPLGAVHILPAKQNVKGIECAVCKEMVSMLEKELHNKTTEEAKKALEEFCKLLPSEESQKCLDFVNQYAYVIINLILSEATPEKVCAILDACPSAKLLKAMKNGMKVKGPEECQVCEVVIGFVQKELNSSEAKQLVQNVLDKVCTLVPSGYKQLCEVFINQYAPEIIAMLDKELNPVQLCTELHLCTSSVDHAKSHPLKFQPMINLLAARRHP